VLTNEQRELFQKPNIGHLATISRDGTPHLTPLWIDIDGDDVLINTAKGRVKVRNIERDPRVGVEVVDQHNPYRAVSFRGRVVEITEEGADEHIDALAKKYLGKDKYPFRQPGEQRIILRIEPEKVAAAA
jgi:PPOX class probable F420-dependent enzyme